MALLIRCSLHKHEDGLELGSPEPMRKLSMVGLAANPDTGEAEAGGSIGWHSGHTA